MFLSNMELPQLTLIEMHCVAASFLEMFCYISKEVFFKSDL